MSGIKVSLDEAGCLLTDGHTSEGAELAVRVSSIMFILFVSPFLCYYCIISRAT